MRTSQIITAALFALACTAAPAMAEQTSKAETVAFELDLSSDASDLYKDISAQAWKACSVDRTSSSILSRAGNVRKCQKRLIADVVQSLGNPIVAVLAQADGIIIKNS